jgi:hypothetical protein
MDLISELELPPMPTLLEDNKPSFLLDEDISVTELMFDRFSLTLLSDEQEKVNAKANARLTVRRKRLFVFILNSFFECV